MRSLPLLVVTVIAAGSSSAIASTLTYEFDFAANTNSPPASFFYVAASPTLPGTILSNVQTSLDLIFPLVAGRDATGAWSFFWADSPTFSLTFTTQTDLEFPNTPGTYSEPSLITSQIMFVTTTVPGTVDILIQAVPEPGTAWLVAGSLLLALGVRTRARA